ncbi:hypothetical protein [Haladaptatus litoreus]|uniref:hypothetical protein n=1 Tax=Haladaptatus litoreus TaxID=553468 RepID=UPI001115A219|nr:hypothetical protein [Haladaptatus litoreus]
MTDGQHLAVLLLILGVAGSALNVVITNPYIQTFPPALAVAGGLALFESTDIDHSLSGFALDWRLTVSLALGVTTALGLLYQGGGGRSTATLMLTVLLYLCAALAIVSSGDLRLQVGLILLAGVVHRATMLYASPIPMGSDTMFHQRMAAQIAETHTLEPLAVAGSKHYYSPIYHLLVSNSMLIHGVNAQTASFLVVSIPALVVPVTVVAAVSRQEFGSTYAALSAYFVTISDAILKWAVTPATTTLGFVLVSCIILCLLRTSRSSQREYHALAMALFGVLIITHQTSAFIAATGITLLYSARSIVDGVSRVLLPLIAWLAVLGSWMGMRYAGPNSPDILTLIFSLFVAKLAASGGGGTGELPEYLDVVPAGSAGLTILHTIAPALVLGFGVLGGVLLIRSRRSGWNRYFELLVVAGGLTAVAFGGPLVGFAALLPFRWFPFIYLCLALTAPAGILALSRHLPQTPRPLAICAVLICITAFMGGTYLGAFDSPVFDDSSQAMSYAYSASEVEMLEHSAKYNGGATVSGERLSTLTVRRWFDGDSEAVHYIANENRVATPTDDLLILDRPYSHTDHAWYDVSVNGTTRSVVGELPSGYFQCGKDVVYSAGKSSIRYSTDGCRGL